MNKDSLSYTKWKEQYHVVFIAQYRQKCTTKGKYILAPHRAEVKLLFERVVMSCNVTIHSAEFQKQQNQRE